MIHVVKKALKDFDVHLASSSPRRKNILEHVGLQFTVTPSTFEESTLDKSLFAHASDFVMECSKQKALNVEKILGERKTNGKPCFIISTDTVVVADEAILEKPLTHEKALQMLTRLKEIKIHYVYSGVTLLKCDNSQENIRQFFEMTEVEFGEIPNDVIKTYADTLEPLDKAGAYGIQDNGATLVKRINGCFYNVQGFPLYKFCEGVCEWFG